MNLVIGRTAQMILNNELTVLNLNAKLNTNHQVNTNSLIWRKPLEKNIDSFIPIFIL